MDIMQLYLPMDKRHPVKLIQWRYIYTYIYISKYK